jgi:hypothetical protein
MKVAKGGGTPVLLVTGQHSVVSVAVDPTSVYWIDKYGGTVTKLTPK